MKTPLGTAVVSFTFTALLAGAAAAFPGMGQGNDPHSQGAPQASGGPLAQPPMHSPGMSGPVAGEIVYTPPKEWVKETPSSGMRKDQYKLPGAKGQDATLAVFFFPGTGGSVDANLQRWYGQFKKADGSAVTGPEEKKDFKNKDLPVTVIYLTGTYLESNSPMMMSGPVTEKPGYALLAAIAETKDGPWFFKTTGPKATVDKWRKSFDQFAKSLKVKK